MKKLVSVITFSVVLIIAVNISNEIFVEKYLNRYYMLSQEIKEINDIDVQVYGSCHSYTSFNTLYFTETYGISSYNMANPGEIMPSTYLRMLERFKTDKPKVVLVDIWGVNAYETYDKTERILDYYLRSNIEDIPISRAKLEVINDFEALDMLEDNFAVAKYKDRLLELSLNELDFSYSFKKANEMYNADGTLYSYNEMENRIAHNGFKSNPSTPISNYDELQAKVDDNDMLRVEADLLKYVDKIIELCKKNNVEIIFYRAPYRSTKNELRKVNYLRVYFEEKEVLFYDLEKELQYNYEEDFYDYEHLSELGAKKATVFLSEKIMSVIGE